MILRFYFAKYNLLVVGCRLLSKKPSALQYYQLYQNIDDPRCSSS
jgi:hypothetical protein